MTAPSERAFVIFTRGEARDEILRGFRLSLRDRVDPNTGQLFTEDVIRRVTQFGSRFYAEADAIDLIGMAIQKRAEFFANQARIDRANARVLRDVHGKLWGESELSAEGASGVVLGKASAGTIWQGSTTVPDPFAVNGVDVRRNRYQVFVGGTTPANGQIPLIMVAIDTGVITNIDVGEIITWSNAPGGAQPTAAVTVDFDGGIDAENSEDFAARLSSRIRRKPGSGNDAHFRTFSRQASNAVEDAFVYPTAFHAGSVLVVLTQKRAASEGPNARVASLATIADVTGFIVPPGSPAIPDRVFVLVVTFQPETTDMAVQLSQDKGTAAGWTDGQPWPTYDTAGLDAAAFISSIATQQDFVVTTEAGSLPGGVTGPLTGTDAPSVMVWNDASSRFEKLEVSSVEETAPGTYQVLLSTPPSKTLVVNDFISPEMGRRLLLAESVETYFDGLGPGEVIDLATDTRATRAFRRPEPTEQFPSRAGQAVITTISDALGATIADATLVVNTKSTPTIPTDIADGPFQIIIGKFAAYDLP